MFTRRSLLPNLLLILIFLIFMGTSVAVSRLVGNNLREQAQLRFENQTSQITSLIQSRMNLYTDVSYGLQGLFAASTDVTESEWQSYIKQIDVPNHYSGISAISYAPKVDKENTNKLPFIIYPHAVKDVYYPFAYTTNFTEGTSTLVGFDISSEQERGDTLTKAIETGVPAATPVLLSVNTKIPVFSVYSPVYTHKTPSSTVEERKENVGGIISITFRLQKIFPDLFSGPLIDKKIDAEVYEGSTLLYDTNVSGVHNANDLTRTATIQIADRTWIIAFHSAPSVYFPLVERFGERAITIFGFSLSICITIFIGLYMRSRVRMLLNKSIQLEALVRGFPYGVLIEDENRKIVLGNVHTLTMLGQLSHPEAFLNKRVPDLIGLLKPLVKEFDAFIKRDAEIVAKKEVVVDEKVELVNDTYISRGYVPLFYEGRHRGGMWIYKDITEQQKIDRMKTEFVSLASHQLRTPLTAIRWYTELMMDTATPGKLTKVQKEYISEINAASDRMVELVGALLNISRIELGTFVIEPGKIDLIEVMNVAVREQEMSFKAKKQKFTFEYPDKIPSIPLDKKIIHIVVQNLLSNACKYTPEKGSVALAVKKVGKGKDEVLEISCTDTGCGIPRDQQQNIFKKLFRATNVQALSISGTGLGLYLVKIAVEASGCSISFVSEENKGTTFTVTIPKVGMASQIK